MWGTLRRLLSKRFTAPGKIPRHSVCSSSDRSKSNCSPRQIPRNGTESCRQNRNEAEFFERLHGGLRRADPGKNHLAGLSDHGRVAGEDEFRTQVAQSVSDVIKVARFVIDNNDHVCAA